MHMINNDLVKDCHYYKGESDNPYENGDGVSFWEYERAWIIMCSAESDTLLRCTNEYKLTVWMALKKMTVCLSH